MAADVALAPSADESARVLAQPSPVAAFWSAFRENRGALIGLGVVGAVVLIAIGADFIAPHSPIEQFRDFVRAPPVWSAGGTWRFPLGTDGDGHDTLSRLIYGARVSLFIGLAVMSVSFVIGVALGLVAAMTGSAVDVAITRVMDLIMAVPSLVLAILVVAILGPSLINTIVAVTIVYLPRYVRLVRASALGELNKDYVDRRARRRRRAAGLMFVDRAAQLPGAADRAGRARRLRRDPRGGGARLPRPRRPAADAGMGLDARRLRANSSAPTPGSSTLPGLAILITVVAINLTGDGLRDALDPKMRRS